MFEVKWRDSGEKVKVYDTLTKTIKGNGYLYQDSEILMFLIFNKKQDRWEEVSSRSFVPVEEGE
ncbi:hypothetical protein WKH56_19615 [Priestia sp. SB1]|uniref:hypothetical protein n=1 Tax=Priestia sp. SB1 TaxID=3132359 RepID=UPI00317EA491